MRRRKAPKRRIKSDPVYNSKLVSHFINSIMRKGKKSIAERIFYNVISILNKNVATQQSHVSTEVKDSSEDELALFKKAIDNVKPLLEVKGRRVGGATYQVPIDVKSDRRISLAIRWILNAANVRHGKSMVEKLAAELLDAFNNTGAAVKKREDMHRMAEANRAFVHYRW